MQNTQSINVLGICSDHLDAILIRQTVTTLLVTYVAMSVSCSPITDLILFRHFAVVKNKIQL